MIEAAKKRVKEKKEFYGHLNVFCIVSFTLVLINYLNSPEEWWVVDILFLWVMTISGHYLYVFGLPSLSLRDKIWEEEQFDTEMEKLEKQQTLEQEKNDGRLELGNLLKSPKGKNTNNKA